MTQITLKKLDSEPNLLNNGYMELKVNEINMLPLTDYIKMLTGSVDRLEDDYGISLSYMFDEKILDECMGSIIESIMEYGFIVPIEMVVIGDERKQGNGHHRLCAAILLNVETIPVLVREADSFWDLDFRSTQDYKGNKYYEGAYDFTAEGEKANDAWSPLMHQVWRSL